jgi:large subunit ribosomal protein L29
VVQILLRFDSTSEHDDSMKAQEVHNLRDEEITVEVERLRRHLFDLRCQSVTEKIEDTSQFRKTRRDIARLLGEARKREMERQST